MNNYFNQVLPLFTIKNNEEVSKGIDVHKITVNHSSGIIEIPIIYIAKNDNYIKILPVELLEDSETKKEWNKHKKNINRIWRNKKGIKGLQTVSKKRRNKKNKNIRWLSLFNNKRRL